MKWRIQCQRIFKKYFLDGINKLFDRFKSESVKVFQVNMLKKNYSPFHEHKTFHRYTLNLKLCELSWTGIL